jgi:hypothetical protein
MAPNHAFGYGGQRFASSRKVPELLGFPGRLAKLCGHSALLAKPLQKRWICRCCPFVLSPDREKIVLTQDVAGTAQSVSRFL